jgi:alkaline phosphatase/alkaline phosphatase D
MPLLVSLRRCGAILIASIVVSAALACERRQPEVLPDLPEDPRERAPVAVPEPTAHWQGEMAGEVTHESVLLQARLSIDGKVRFRDVRGRPGIAAFALSTEKDLSNAFRTRWMLASSQSDYIVKTRVNGLAPATRYHYRLLSGSTVDSLEAGPTGTFRTLDGRGISREVSFVAITGMNQFAFHYNSSVDKKELGFPALGTIVSEAPDFLVATGDNVYYDSPAIWRAKSRQKMRAKWHRQFATPRFAALFQRVPVYWEKDDHDHRYNDSDPHGPLEPSSALGIEIFLEQVPVVDPAEANPVTYRAHRVNDLLQIWLTEGRDYRDANTKPPGPDKTMWGAEQKAWLKRTLLESDATFKVLISPTPMIGPDDRVTGVQGGILSSLGGGSAIGQGDDERKLDNHTNPDGFKDEAEEFFAWLSRSGFHERNFYIVCGDRHWQYHSIRPDGFEEFSTGALIDGNARLGPRPGDEFSTDPDARISQPHAQDEKSGGFLKVTVRPGQAGEPPAAKFAFYDEKGAALYQVERSARERSDSGSPVNRRAPSRPAQKENRGP